jgi:hypothetical protein
MTDASVCTNCHRSDGGPLTKPYEDGNEVGSLLESIGMSVLICKRCLDIQESMLKTLARGDFVFRD